MPIPVPEGPSPSHAPSTPGRVVSDNDYEPNNSDTTANNNDHGMGQDEGDIADIFKDDMDVLASIEADLMVSALIAAGTDRQSAPIFTSTVCALTTGPTLLEVCGRGRIKVEANGPRKVLKNT